MVRRMVAAGLLGTSLAVAATGCASGTEKKASPAPPSVTAAPSSAASQAAGQLPPGLHAINDLNHYISVGVPDSWTVINLSPSEIEQSLQKAGITDPQVKAQVKQLQTAGALYAVDSESAAHSSNRFSTNLNGFCQATGLGSLNVLKAAGPDQFAKIGGRNVQVTDVTVDGNPALRWSYELKLATGTIEGRQVQALAKGKLCTITFSTDQIDRYETVFNAMIPTIRLT
ncbi:hypothetical protein ACRYCC_22700 [Actinomadura scrupuli]|uniref:hypothetical protein n=1 Tax=Actinomadura scrupuli TaxID=559629 RepID=UPI003D9594C2